MYKKQKKYVDFFGEERTETMYFNLTEQEVSTLEATFAGGMGFSKFLDQISKAKDRSQIASMFKQLIDISYGVVSGDGRKFDKTALADFQQTQLYSDYFMELSTNTSEAVAFIQGILPGANKISTSVLQRVMEDPSAANMTLLENEVKANAKNTP